MVAPISILSHIVLYCSPLSLKFPPRACYDEGKRVAETLAYAYNKQSGVEVRVARIFNTYGPRMHANDGRVVSNFVIQVRDDK